jgi:hypothetical protein
VIGQTLAACSLLLGTPLSARYASVSLPAKVRIFPLPPFPARTPEAAFSQLTLLQRPWDKLRCAANIVFVPKPADQDFVHPPAALSFLYYQLRMLRLIRKAGLEESGSSGAPQPPFRIAWRTLASCEKSCGKASR